MGTGSRLGFRKRKATTLTQGKQRRRRGQRDSGQGAEIAERASLRSIAGGLLAVGGFIEPVSAHAKFKYADFRQPAVEWSDSGSTRAWALGEIGVPEGSPETTRDIEVFCVSRGLFGRHFMRQLARYHFSYVIAFLTRFKHGLARTVMLGGNRCGFGINLVE